MQKAYYLRGNFEQVHIPPNPFRETNLSVTCEVA